MANSFRVPNAEEEKIIRRNGLDPQSVAVILSSEDTLVLRHYKSGDDIFIHAGCKAWSKY